jgi:hypothetical protein
MGSRRLPLKGTGIMAMNIQNLQIELLKLPAQERLHFLHHLIDTPQITNKVEMPANPLLPLAGHFVGGPGDTAERAEEILEAEINPASGLSQ